jgi:tRNA(Arg) A34 adenosine deaminase TadA
MNNNIMNLRDMLSDKRSAFVSDTTPKSYRAFQNFEHICVIMTTNGAPLAYGYNTYKTDDYTTEHAEAMAFRKLNCVRKKLGIRGRLNVNLLVVRTNGGNSKPCSKCIECMQSCADKYNVRKVYYSNNKEPNGIQKETFSSLVNDPNKHISSFYRFQQEIKENEIKAKENIINIKKMSKKMKKMSKKSSR